MTGLVMQKSNLELNSQSRLPECRGLTFQRIMRWVETSGKAPAGQWSSSSIRRTQNQVALRTRSPRNRDQPAAEGDRAGAAQLGLHGEAHDGAFGAQAGLHGAAHDGGQAGFAGQAQLGLAGAAHDGFGAQQVGFGQHLQPSFGSSSLGRSSFGMQSFGSSSFGMQSLGSSSFGRLSVLQQGCGGHPQSLAWADTARDEARAIARAVTVSFFIE
jgi:hypothetical protein